MLARSRHASKLKVEFFDISDGKVAFDDYVVQLDARLVGETVCLAVGDAAMNLYASVVEAQLQKTMTADERKNEEERLRGASFLCNFIATNKLACRDLLAGCGGIRYGVVRSEDEFLPSIGVTSFFKPLALASSTGVRRCEFGIQENNPLWEEAKKTASPLLLTSPLSTPMIRRLASRHKELVPYLDEGVVGIVEEYVAPSKCRKVSIDGFVCRGEVTHYCISANVYKEDRPEVFDSLVTPAQDLTAAEIAASWELFDTVAADLMRRGLRDQFFDVEAFVYTSSKTKTVRVEVMEVNCRPYSNQLPIFSRIFGEENSMFSAAVDLLQGLEPPIHRDFASSIVIPIDKMKGTQTTKRMETVGVCAYLPPIEDAPCLVHAADGSASYYAVPGHPAHVYAFGKDAAKTRLRCDEFHTELRIRYGEKK